MLGGGGLSLQHAAGRSRAPDRKKLGAPKRTGALYLLGGLRIHYAMGLPDP